MNMQHLDMLRLPKLESSCSEAENAEDPWSGFYEVIEKAGQCIHLA